MANKARDYYLQGAKARYNLALINRHPAKPCEYTGSWQSKAYAEGFNAVHYEIAVQSTAVKDAYWVATGITV